ncbi:uncharacterized protein TEOVI_000192200 [Trypanosoma equiperdum]|nr:conserved protein [Trypanosoma equiperdum]
MWRRGILLLAPPRVLCLTMAPGGTMATALTQLGYKPYTFRHTFTEGRVGTHPQEWCAVLDKEKAFDSTILGNSQCGAATAGNGVSFDALVGLPSTLAFESILRECPLSTRVILVEETDKDAWMREAETTWELLLQQTERAARRRAGAYLHKMVQKMTTGIVSGGCGKRKQISPVAFIDMLEERIKKTVPRDRLLVYRYGDGWEPLCRFLSKPLPTGDGTEPLPFPARDDGTSDVAYLADRLQRVDRVVWWATCCLVAAAIVIYTPFCAQLRDIVAEYYVDYRSSFEPLLEESAASGGKLTLRRALVLAKNTTMAFEEKLNERGGVVGAAGEALSKLT